MKYRITTARLIVATHGEAFTPLTGALPHMYAASLDAGPVNKKIQTGLTAGMLDWVSNDYADPKTAVKLAMNQALNDLAKKYLAALGNGAYELASSEPVYKPIYDKTGTKIIGHDTVAWVKLDGKYVTGTTSPAPILTMYACVLVSVGEAA